MAGLAASAVVELGVSVLLPAEEREHVPWCLSMTEHSRSSSAQRFARAMKLFDLGMAIRGQMSEDVRERLRKLDEEHEVGPGLRISPERFEKLKLRE